MAINTAVLDHIAHLARLVIREEEKEGLAQELSGILEWVEALNEVDVEGTEPMVSPLDGLAPLREDRVDDGDKRSHILSNAPHTQEGYFVVPKVIE